MHSVFDWDIIDCKRRTKVYGLLFLLMLISLLLILFLGKKERIYEGTLYYSELDKVYLLTNKEVFKDIKDNNKMIIDDIEYDFIIEKIEKKDDNYLINISFTVDIEFSNNKYQIILGKENIISFIIRIIRGE